ncbi:BbrUII/HgiDII family restriction enzyme [Solilutibacter silvestris]|uniref:BbrUII/HgiDII family restriction enzyme n=1 Tax=Solilutibacter silvestris TaxID=1645665 RepID=UPI003D336710
MNTPPAQGPLRFTLHINVLHHLGMKLYASSPSILAELVANAWDADAKTVKIEVIDKPNGAQLTISDNGHGMTRAEVQARFLNVGYNRRDFTHSNTSQSGKRKVMGRKGIGKLSMFSIANKIEIHTQAAGNKPVRFTIDVTELEKVSLSEAEYFPVEDIDAPELPGGQGTKITLSGLNRSINRTQTFLIPRLARRFGIIGPANDFVVEVNNEAVTRKSAGIYDHLQFFWYFDDESRIEAITLEAPVVSLPSLGKERAFQKLPSTFNVEGTAVTVRGFIATADQPSRLGEKDESINQISLFVNGRMWQEDLLAEIGDTRYFNSYIVGEIHADFLDADGIDRATSARESIIHHDPFFIAIQKHLKDCLRTIRDQWDLWRAEVNPNPEDPAILVMDEWIDSLGEERDKKLARKLVNSIGKVELANDDQKNRSARRMLYRSTMVAFEKLRIRSALHKLDEISDVFSPEFQQIFATMDDVEESYFFDISRQRLEVIQAFQQKVADKELEKVIQKYLLDHLWLLDPTWERIPGTAQDEITLTKYLKDKFPKDDDNGARLDIAYRNQSGRHVVIELKRPGVKVAYDKIQHQCNKYRKAVTEYVAQHGSWMDGGGAPSKIAIYFVVSDKSHLDSDEIKSLEVIGVTVLTYNTLIISARNAYKAYFERQSQAHGRIETFLSRLDDQASTKNQTKQPEDDIDMAAAMA